MKAMTEELVHFIEGTSHEFKAVSVGKVTTTVEGNFVADPAEEEDEY